MLHRNSITS